MDCLQSSYYYGVYVAAVTPIFLIGLVWAKFTLLTILDSVAGFDAQHRVSHHNFKSVVTTKPRLGAVGYFMLCVACFSQSNFLMASACPRVDRLGQALRGPHGRKPPAYLCVRSAG